MFIARTSLITAGLIASVAVAAHAAPDVQLPTLKLVRVMPERAEQPGVPTLAPKPYSGGPVPGALDFFNPRNSPVHISGKVRWQSNLADPIEADLAPNAVTPVFVKDTRNLDLCGFRQWKFEPTAPAGMAQRTINITNNCKWSLKENKPWLTQKPDTVMAIKANAVYYQDPVLSVSSGDASNCSGAFSVKGTVVNKTGAKVTATIVLKTTDGPPVGLFAQTFKETSSQQLEPNQVANWTIQFPNNGQLGSKLVMDISASGGAKTGDLGYSIDTGRSCTLGVGLQ